MALTHGLGEPLGGRRERPGQIGDLDQPVGSRAAAWASANSTASVQPEPDATRPLIQSISVSLSRTAPSAIACSSPCRPAEHADRKGWRQPGQQTEKGAPSVMVMMVAMVVTVVMVPMIVRPCAPP